MTENAADEALDAALTAIEAGIADDPEGALRALDRLDPAAIGAEGRYLRGVATWSAHGAAAAEPLLRDLIAEDPSFTDAHYALAGIYEELGDPLARSRHNLVVLALDTAESRREGLDSSGENPNENPNELEPATATATAEIARLAETTLASLPAELRQRLGNVAVVIEPRPHWEVVADGFDPRALGMFEGPDDYGQRSLEVAPMTSRIVLFAANILACFVSPETLEEEVRVTVLHEIGHYFGLDEDEVAALGLE